HLGVGRDVLDAGEPPVVQAVRADLDAGGGRGAHLVGGHQRLVRAGPVPVVRAAERTGDDENRCAPTVPGEHRHDVGDEVAVPVVEGEPDETGAVVRGQQL